MDGAAADDWDRTRLREDQIQDVHSPFVPPGSERRMSNASSVGVKREREETSQPSHDREHAVNGVAREAKENKRPRLEGHVKTDEVAEMPPTDPDGSHDLKLREEALRVERGNKIEAEVVNAVQKEEEGEDVEEGEVEE